MELKDLIRIKRNQLNLTLEEIGTAVGVSKATVQRWESGNISNLRRDRISKLAEVLRIDPIDLITVENKSPKITTDTVLFPVVGEIAAGYDHIAIENWNGDTIEIPISYLKGRNREDFFVLSVCGNSMYPQYQNGDKVLILKQHTYENGSICAVIYDGECATLKKIEKTKNGITLIPINPEYMPKEISGSELENFYVLGIPKCLIREI